VLHCNLRVNTTEAIIFLDKAPSASRYLVWRLTGYTKMQVKCTDKV
jgi:hypothetical protein